jgi:endoglucanase
LLICGGLAIRQPALGAILFLLTVPHIRALFCLLLFAAVAFAQHRRGVNVSGAEFGMSNIPGALGHDYTFNSEPTFQYFAAKHLGLVRLPLLWERLQPQLRGPLEPAYLANLKRNVAWAKAHGGEVIVDIHNFARYSFNQGGSLKTYIIDNVASDGAVHVSTADLADLWTRLSTEFKFEGAVYAYDLMNEPHDMGTANWKIISQAVLDAIRANQDDKLVLIPGDSYSSANRWVTTHGLQSWIRDPANNFAYEAHQYFDRDESGTYARSYDAELAGNSDLANVGRTRVSHFIAWCAANGVRGVVDEYGIPDTDPRWLAVLDNFLAALDDAGMDGAYWAAGEWWGSYPLSVQPTANFTEDRPQMPTLLAHAGGGFLTALSAASASVARATPGSLVSLYGSGFTTQTAQAQTVPYPVALADITVQVTDGAGATNLAGLLYVGPGQVNLQMPVTLAPGRATVAVIRGALQVAAGTIQVAATAPAIFTAQIIRVKPDGSQTSEPVSPIDFGLSTDRLFLVLYATAIHGAAISLRIGSLDVPLLYAGPQLQYPGLDQINSAELPRSLAGAGQLAVILTCDGIPANTIAILFQ